MKTNVSDLNNTKFQVKTRIQSTLHIFAEIEFFLSHLEAAIKTWI